MAQPFPGFVPMQFARNALPPPGQMARAIGRAANELIANFGCLWPVKSLLPNGSTVRNSATDSRLWVQRIRSGPNGTKLMSRVRLIPTDTTAGNPTWYLKVDGVAQTAQQHNSRCTAGSGTRLDDVFEMEQEVTVTRDAMHTVELWTKDNCRVVGWGLHEKPRGDLTAGSDTFVDLARILPLSGIYDADLASMMSVIEKVVRYLRGGAMYFQVDDPLNPIIVSSAVAANIWDSTDTIGSLAETDYKNTYMNEVLGTLSIPTTVWTWAERASGAGSGTVRFIGGNHAGGVNVTVNSTIAIYEDTTNFTLKAQTAGDLQKVHALITAGTVMNVFAVGVLPIL